MSEEETKVEAATEAPATEGSTTEEAPLPRKRERSGRSSWAFVVLVLIAAGAWLLGLARAAELLRRHRHTPMDEYLETYEQEPGTTGVDKWGNEVSNTNAMLAVSHKAQGKDCMSCHVPTLSEQMSEGINWVTGNYVYPLEERDTDMLTEARGLDGDEFCLNESCHNLTRDDLVKATSGMEFNPHKAQHGEIECSECHKAHRASVMYCTQCHSEAEVPEGWLTVAEANKLSTAA